MVKRKADNILVHVISCSQNGLAVIFLEKIPILHFCCACFFNLFVYLFLQEPSLYTLKAIAILDNDGNRLLAKVFYKITQSCPCNEYPP